MVLDSDNSLFSMELRIDFIIICRNKASNCSAVSLMALLASWRIYFELT
jgi:hypothetical protein